MTLYLHMYMYNTPVHSVCSDQRTTSVQHSNQAIGETEQHKSYYIHLHTCIISTCTCMYVRVQGGQSYFSVGKDDRRERLIKPAVAPVAMEEPATVIGEVFA